MSTGSKFTEAGTPHDKQWLADCADLVKAKMPENYCFVVFGFPASGSDRIFYASNAKREDIREALRQWLEKSGPQDHGRHVE